MPVLGLFRNTLAVCLTVYFEFCAILSCVVLRGNNIAIPKISYEINHTNDDDADVVLFISS